VFSWWYTCQDTDFSELVFFAESQCKKQYSKRPEQRSTANATVEILESIVLLLYYIEILEIIMLIYYYIEILESIFLLYYISSINATVEILESQLYRPSI
jgi:hypothetical protein